MIGARRWPRLWDGPYLNCGTGLDCGTGFSRESVRRHTARSGVVTPASSRLKPVPLKAAHASSGTGCDLDCRTVPTSTAGLASTVGGPYLNCGTGLDCGTGFSRESVRRHTARLGVVTPASSRLRPVPLKAAHASSGTGCDLDCRTVLTSTAGLASTVGPALAGKASGVTLLLLPDSYQSHPPDHPPDAR
ncbi:hypothetical protein SAMN05216197_11443 [Pseudomonas graminis]|uniref:Uncharacterized protein n=1 Tax=Pseudomonas graminis TaxID=158627 RepID=A0A1I0EM63_9PSED|nr:hypothetical protein SAMN05216197_11443 [Pseudomonas graminis]